jgi:hypothetical protein
MKKGAVNVADGWIGGLQEPNGLNCRKVRDASGPGHADVKAKVGRVART